MCVPKQSPNFYLSLCHICAFPLRIVADVFFYAKTLNRQTGGISSFPGALAVLRIHESHNPQNVCKSTKNVIKRRYATYFLLQIPSTANHGGVGSSLGGLAALRVNKSRTRSNWCKLTKHVIKRSYLTISCVFLPANHKPAVSAVLQSVWPFYRLITAWTVGDSLKTS